ncbi:hypothetical protein Z043_102714 [Scleropages formosus]|uniref:Uncharacterized protein n=1 Tax=Scleropages formosus TaxID=113540 RepID=A0A0N8K2I5_SCLFO|nr:hypothetical protein Z043_102714 [Scleropages formosus]
MKVPWLCPSGSKRASAEKLRRAGGTCSSVRRDMALTRLEFPTSTAGPRTNEDRGARRTPSPRLSIHLSLFPTGCVTCRSVRSDLARPELGVLLAPSEQGGRGVRSYARASGCCQEPASWEHERKAAAGSGLPSRSVTNTNSSPVPENRHLNMQCLKKSVHFTIPKAWAKQRARSSGDGGNAKTVCAGVEACSMPRCGGTVPALGHSGSAPSAICSPMALPSVAQPPPTLVILHCRTNEHDQVQEEMLAGRPLRCPFKSCAEK